MSKAVEPATVLRCLTAVLVGVFLSAAASGQEAAESSARQAQRAALQRQLHEHAQLLEAQSNVLRLAAKLIGPSVVHIEADVPPAPGLSLSRGRSEESGSGVIIEHRGRNYVLTNRHVVRNAEPRSIRINLADGRRIRPTKVFDDAATDVAVLAVEAADLTPAPLGDSDRLQIGDFVLAFGSPFGLSQSVTFGIISAKGRRALRLGSGNVEDLELKDFLQTDAAINPGNSGGPLVDMRGEVVGINTAIASSSGGNEGIGFAIPINMFMTFARQLIETGKVTRAFLGVNLNANFTAAQAAEAGLPRAMGAQVTAVTPGSPAEAAKLQAGDVIVEFNNIPVEDDSHLVNLVGVTEVGRKVSLVIFRDRRPMTITVELSRREKNGQ
jgi:serine protease Do